MKVTRTSNTDISAVTIIFLVFLLFLLWMIKIFDSSEATMVILKVQSFFILLGTITFLNILLKEIFEEKSQKQTRILLGYFFLIILNIFIAAKIGIQNFTEFSFAFVMFALHFLLSLGCVLINIRFTGYE